MTDAALSELLHHYAEVYETPAFLEGDPSGIMHEVEGRENREAAAFVTACLSYGSRPLFLARVREILALSGGDVDGWIRAGAFAESFPAGDGRCFYRLDTVGCMHAFFEAYRTLLQEHGSLGEYVAGRAKTGPEATQALCDWFRDREVGHLVPRDTASACKRLCMFLRWMVRDGSPVDLGLWAPFIDRRTLIIPLDTHVLRQAAALGLLPRTAPSMRTAVRLTERLREFFPDDPLRGDFALFGYGVNHKTRR